MSIPWGVDTRLKFKAILERIPVFMRGIAEEKITQKALIFAQTAGHATITEKDMVDAFFSETPFGFHGPMKSDMTAVGIDYQQYGHPE